MKLNAMRGLKRPTTKDITRFSVVLLVFIGCFFAPAVGAATITQIKVVGQPVKIFDHKQRVEKDNISDGAVNTWREADGTVNLMLPHYEAYRLRGPNLLNLILDRNKIFSSRRSAGYIKEDLYNLVHWPMGPYSLDGHNFYSLAHHEWFAALLDPSFGGLAKWLDSPDPGGLAKMFDHPDPAGTLAKLGGLNSWVT